MKIRHFLLLVVVLVSSWVVGCAPTQRGMEFLRSGGRGEVAGEMSGVAFSAVVELSPNGEGVRVEYLSPDSLCGLIFVSNGEECEVRLGEVQFVCNAAEVAGFLRPATALLPQGDATSAQKAEGNTVLTYPSGQVLTVDTNGVPLSSKGEDIELCVVWWECGTGSGS